MRKFKVSGLTKGGWGSPRYVGEHFTIEDDILFRPLNEGDLGLSLENAIEYMNDHYLIEEEFENPKLIDVIMEHLDVKENEEFKIKGLTGFIHDRKLKFSNGKIIYSSNEHASSVIVGIISGKYSIVKIPQTKTLVIDGKEIEISKELFEALKKHFK